MKALIRVTLKPDMLDPQGQALGKALGRLGFNEVSSARVGKFIELDLKESNKEKATQRVKEMCQKLLSNPVIENTTYELKE